MNDFGCRGSAWDYSADEQASFSSGVWRAASRLENAFRVAREKVPDARKPSKSYSKRSSHINELREQSRWHSENAGFDLSGLNKLAVAAAESFINSLPEGTLDFEMAISHSGEINFFFGDKGNKPFQVLVEESGFVTYYGEILDEKVSGSDVAASDFPYLKLLKFVDRNK